MPSLSLGPERDNWPVDCVVYEPNQHCYSHKTEPYRNEFVKAINRCASGLCPDGDTF